MLRHLCSMYVELLTYSVRLNRPMAVITLLGTDMLWAQAEERRDAAGGAIPHQVIQIYNTHRPVPFEIDLRDIDLAVHPRWTNDRDGAQRCIDDLRPYIRMSAVITPALPAVKRSIEYDAGALQLVGDQDAPPADHYYGTDPGAALGYHPLPVGGDVTGPASAVDDDIALFDGATGKLIKSAGINLTEVVERYGLGDVGLIHSTASSPIVLRDVNDGDGTEVQANTGSFQINVKPKNSVEVDAGEVQLVGDEASPGNNEYYGTDSGGMKGFHPLTIPSSENVQRDITQAGHGLTVGQVVYFNGTNYIPAQADAEATAEAVGVVSAVAGVNDFTIITHGLVVGLSGLVSGTVYFISSATPGLLTATAPSASGHVRKAQLIALSTTSGHYNNFVGYVIP